MKRTLLSIFGFSIVSTILCACTKEIEIAKDSQASLKIAIPDTPTHCEKYSAQLLKKYLDKITNAKFEILPESKLPQNSKAIFVGETKKSQDALADFNSKTAPFDAIRIKSDKENIYIKGHARRGTLYAVSAFLEDCTGVKAWAEDDIYVPQKTSLKISPTDISYAPQLTSRKTDYRVGTNCELRVLQYSGFPIPADLKLRKEIGESYAVGYHSFYKILPPKKYFKEHPQWYSLINGKRTDKDAQLCLTNEEMTKEFIKIVCEKIKKAPHARFAHISQNDWDGVCQCKKCTDFVNAHGGVQSAVYLNFANKIAEAVEKINPDIRIVTFAYTFTRKAPKNIKPRHNVWIELCSIECDFAHALETDKDYGFTQDIIDWGKLTKNLVIWDYVTSFKDYQIPFANIHNLDDNIKFFVKNGAIGLFEQADQKNVTGEFVRLRNWYLNKLMWNPSLDGDKLIDEFLSGYYSPEVAPFLRTYIDTIEKRVNNVRFSLSCFSTDPLYWLDAKTYAILSESLHNAYELAKKLEKENPQKYKNLSRKIWRDKLPLDYIALTKWVHLVALAKKEGVELKYPQDLVALANDIVKRWNEFGTEKINQRETRENFLNFANSFPAFAKRQIEFLKNNPDLSESTNISGFDKNQAVEFQEGRIDQCNSAKAVATQPANYFADKNASNGWAIYLDENSERLRRFEINLHDTLEKLVSTTSSKGKRKYDIYVDVKTKSQKSTEIIMMLFRKGTWNIYNQGTGKYVPNGDKYVRVYCGEIELNHSRKDSTTFQLWIRPLYTKYSDLLLDRVVVVAK